jgi:peroxiredoxin
MLRGDWRGQSVNKGTQAMGREETNNSDRFLSKGDQAPAFEFTGPGGTRLQSSSLLREGPLLLTFYRGAWCQCCQTDLRDLMGHLTDLERTHTNALAVFHQISPDANARVSREYGLRFPIVDDADGRVAEAFGIRRTEAEWAQIEEELGPVIRTFKDGQPWILPMQARYVVGPDGVIAYSDVVVDYNERSSAADLIPVLERFS